MHNIAPLQSDGAGKPANVFALALTQRSAQPFLIIVMRGLKDATIDPVLRKAIDASLSIWERESEEWKAKARVIEGEMGTEVLADLSAWLERQANSTSESE